MKGDNLSNQMIKFYNGYFSLIIPRSIWLHCVGNCDPHSRASFDLKDIIQTNLVDLEMLHTKYQSCKPSSFREKEF